MILPTYRPVLSTPILVPIVSVGGSDVTPAAVDWTNTGPTARPKSGSTTITTIGQQITGIDTTITLSVNVSLGSIIGTLQYGTNTTNTVPGIFTLISAANPIATNTTSSTFNVTNNQWLFFRYIVGTAVGGYAAGSATLTLTNTSDSNATLDTWTHTNT